MDLDEAAQLVHTTDEVGIPLGPGHPVGFLHALGGRTDWENLTVSGALLTDLYQLFLHPNVRFLSGFFGPIERGYLDAGANIEFVPADFRRFEPLLEQLKPRVVATAVSPPDANGYMSLSLHSGATYAEFKRAAADPDRLLIVEHSPHFPKTFGYGSYSHSLHVSECDVVVESDAKPIDMQDRPAGAAEQAIAEYAAGFVHDRCTLQTGIGSIPSAVATILADGPGGDYGVHSEMFTTGLMRLHLAGKVTNKHKGVLEGFSATTFAAGNRELYDWLDGNDAVRFLPVSEINSQEVISANVDIVTINGAIAIDLYGQVIADTIGGRQFSGVGGHEDFISGAGLELSDRSLVCLKSKTNIAGTEVSRIQPFFEAGSVVTTPRHQLDVVITEFGAAELRGKTVTERARALSEIAAPMFRDELREHAERIAQR